MTNDAPVVLVTGGTGGLGTTIVERMARDGATVVIEAVA